MPNRGADSIASENNDGLYDGKIMGREMMDEKTKLANYYAARARIYEENYDKPERQADLALLDEWVASALRGHHVLELACGTGYWTARFAAGAASVLATDFNTEMLDLARAKDLPADKVEFAVADAFDLSLPPGRAANSAFTACFAGFWFSHVRREQQGNFLAHLRAKLGKDTLLVMIDNNYIEGNSSVIARTDLEGNTFQIRTLPDGSRTEVIKNFPTDSALRKKMGPEVHNIRIERSTYFWMLTCRLK